MNDMTPEQQAELRSKELALQLDLNEQQTKQVKELELKMVQDRQAHMEVRQAMKEEGAERPSKEEMFKMRSEMLDKQKEHQDAMKKILTPEQFTKWKEMRDERVKKVKSDMKDKRQGKEPCGQKP